MSLEEVKEYSEDMEPDPPYAPPTTPVLSSAPSRTHSTMDDIFGPSRSVQSQYLFPSQCYYNRIIRSNSIVSSTRDTPFPDLSDTQLTTPAFDAPSHGKFHLLDVPIICEDDSFGNLVRKMA